VNQRKHQIGLLVALLATATTASVRAQPQVPADAAPAGPFADSGRGLSFLPTLSLVGVVTDNAGASAVDRRKDLLFQATAGLRVQGRLGPVRGALDYRLTGLAYAKNSEFNDVKHALTANGTAELIGRTMWIDAIGTLGTQAASLIDRQAVDSTRLGDAGTRVGTFTITPRVVVPLGALARFEGNVGHTITRTGDAAASSADDTRAFARVGADAYGLAWGLEGTWRRSDLADGSDFEDRLVEVGVSTVLARDYRLGVFGGREWTDFATGDALESNTTWGVRGAWTPSERTSLSGTYRKRSFGDEHQIGFTQRGETMLWSLSDSRSVSTSPVKGTTATTLYDLYALQFVGEADPVRRDALVRDYLRTLGLDPSTPTSGGFVSPGLSKERAQSVSFGLLGPRSTVSLRLTQTRSEAVASRGLPLTGDFALGQVIRQRGVSLEGAHRLTPASSLGAGAEYRRSTTDFGVLSTLKSLQMGWLLRASERTEYTLGARYVVLSGGSSPYKELAALGGVRWSF
jgi:uncharacterized protein (PEP-CTERM system associated)